MSRITIDGAPISARQVEIQQPDTIIATLTANESTINLVDHLATTPTPFIVEAAGWRLTAFAPRMPPIRRNTIRVEFRAASQDGMAQIAG
jgi:hypothetical protein